jgi:hypothetical protein
VAVVADNFSVKAAWEALADRVFLGVAALGKECLEGEEDWAVKQ